MIRIELDKLLKERNVTLKDVADATEINYTILFRYRHNRSTGMQLDDIEKLCKFFDILPNDLIRISHKRTKK